VAVALLLSCMFIISIAFSLMDDQNPSLLNVDAFHRYLSTGLRCNGVGRDFSRRR
jgi:hypothetical protein